MAEKEKGRIEREQYHLVEDKISSFLKKGTSKNIALLGHPKSGKTFILKKLLDEHKEAVYVDMGKIGLSPESFAVEFIGNVLFCFLRKEKKDYKKFLDINFLLNLKNETGNNAFDIIKSIRNELQKIKPDQKLLVESAFSFVEALAENKKIITVLDSFEQIFDLNNFPQIKDIYSIINFDQKNVLYVIASSSIVQLKKTLKFDIIELKNFDLNETELFLENSGIKDKKIIEKIYNLTDGNAHLILLFVKNKEKNIDDYFFSQLLSKNGSIYSYCNAVFENFLAKTSGRTLSKIILRAISLEEGLRLSEIARRVYRSAPVTKALLERLIASDIIYKKDGRYYFYDSVLKLWIKLTAAGYEFDDDSEITDDMIKEVLNII